MRRLTVAITCCLLFCCFCAFDTSPITAATKVSKPSTPRVKGVTTGNNQKEGEIYVTWSKVSCSGYELNYADNSGFKSSHTWTVSSNSVLSRNITNLNKGRRYYMRLRAYKKSGSSKVYSSWSGSKSIVAHEHNIRTRIVAEAFCNKEGSEEYYCTGCKYSYSVVLSGLAHTYRNSVSKAATCKNDGIMTFQCSRCGDNYTEPIARTNTHTKVKSGSKYRCKICGKALGNINSGNSVKSTQAKVTTKSTNATSTSSSVKSSSSLNATQKARQGAADWAIAIANNNEFHYGRTKWAHNAGCYYCGTNQKKGSAKRRAGASVSQCAKTYCCNPFVTAAYKHGAGAQEIDCKRANKRINLANDKNKALNNTKAWKRINKPSEVTSLVVGDVLLTPTHAMLYVGGGKVAHAAHHDNGNRGSYWNDSIKVGYIASSQWKRTSKIYRYIGKGKF